MDHHVPAAITEGLRLRGIDVRTAAEDGTNRLADPLLLDLATALGRALVSEYEDLLIEAARRQQAGEEFAGLFHGRPLYLIVGQCVQDLELYCAVYEPAEMRNQVIFLPLR